MKTLLTTLLLLVSGIATACPQLTGSWVLRGNLGSDRAFVATLGADYDDSAMNITIHESGYVYEYYADVSAGSYRKQGSGKCAIKIRGFVENIYFDGYLTGKFRFVGSMSIDGASGVVIGSKVWL